MSDFSKPTFSIDSHDQDGDVYEEGVYLHFENTRVRVAKDLKTYEDFITHLVRMRREIKTNCDDRREKVS